MPGSVKSSSEVDVALGARIRRIRREQLLTQESLAEELGLTPQQIQKYESGANRVSAARLLEIARVLSEPVASFYPETTVEDGPARTARRLSEQVLSVPSRWHALISDLLEALKER